MDTSPAEPKGTPVHSKTQASMLTDSIRQDIIAGVFQPRSKLKMRELTERYGVGVIPLREALSRLTMSGFVTVEDQKGFRVASVSETELLDITQVRQKIETDALRNSIEHGNLEWESSLLSAAHRLNNLALRTPESEGVNPQWDLAHDAFHSALLGACSSPWLIKLSEMLREQTGRYRHLSVKAESAANRDLAGEHQAIAKAVLDRDADTACRLLAEHFALTTKLVLAQHIPAKKH